jgi:hypothetical protein
MVMQRLSELQPVLWTLSEDATLYYAALRDMSIAQIMPYLQSGKTTTMVFRRKALLAHRRISGKKNNEILAKIGHDTAPALMDFPDRALSSGWARGTATASAESDGHSVTSDTCIALTAQGLSTLPEESNLHGNRGRTKWTAEEDAALIHAPMTFVTVPEPISLIPNRANKSCF